MKTIFTSIICLFCIVSYAQIITSNPACPTADQPVTIFYDSNLGTGGLTEITPVYLHSGLITSESTSSSDWQHVWTTWGSADPSFQMTDEGNGIHSYTFSPSIQEFFSVPDGEDILEFSLVFRNADGSAEGKDDGGADIFYAVSDGSFSVNVLAPSSNSIISAVGDEVNISAITCGFADFTINVNGEEFASFSETEELNEVFIPDSQGEFLIEIIAESGGENLTESFTVLVIPSVTQAPSPEGTIDGINVIDENTAIFKIYAPFKENVFLIGDFNDWSLDLDYMMNLDVDGETFWLEVADLDPNTEYRFQYSIDNDEMRVADIYSDKILDPWNDQWIPSSNYPNPTAYPSGLTENVVSTFQINSPEFLWTDQDFEKPDKTRLTIYELLVRDFVDEENFQTVIDTLDYIERLGFNAIEFMPVNEFEGNNSWGYNPDFFFAVDKQYGGNQEFKTLINECHERGIAVIMDMVLNHSFGLNPQVRMYFDPNAGQFGQPSSESPWFNEIPTHDFNVGFDYNHESPKTREFSKRVLEYWMNEFHIDGYRMDLSKGFTQNNTLGNVSAWGAFDQSRIDILTDYKNHIEDIDPNVYFILEHFANNNEELFLSDQGFMLWGNMNHEYNEASMGWNSNLNWASYQARGWNNPHLISYMESHDEERLMYKNLEFGNSNENYDVTQLGTALDRIELASTFFYPIPGPKMAWQFGELGYDFSINYCTGGTISESCRTAPKPVRWDYRDEIARYDIYTVVSILNFLRNNHDFMHTEDFNLDVSGTGKRIHLNGDINATIIGNFDVSEISMIPGFQHTGEWYEVYTGDSITEENLENPFDLQPGEYRFYIDQEIEIPLSVYEYADQLRHSALNMYPNPVLESAFIELPSGVNSGTFVVKDMTGKTVISESISGHEVVEVLALQRLTNGMYIATLETAQATYSTKIIKN